MWCITTFKAGISHTNDSLGPEMIRYIWKKTAVMGKAGPSDLCFPQSILILFLFDDTHSSSLMKNFPLWASVRTMHQNDARVHIWAHTGVLGLPWWLSRWSPPANAGDTEDPCIRSLDQEDLLEKKMATHSSIPTWKTAWVEELGGLQSIGSQRVGPNWATKHTAQK